MIADHGMIMHPKRYKSFTANIYYDVYDMTVMSGFIPVINFSLLSLFTAFSNEVGIL